MGRDVGPFALAGPGLALGAQIAPQPDAPRGQHQQRPTEHRRHGHQHPPGVGHIGAADHRQRHPAEHQQHPGRHPQRGHPPAHAARGPAGALHLVELGVDQRGAAEHHDQRQQGAQRHLPADLSAEHHQAAGEQQPADHHVAEPGRGGTPGDRPVLGRRTGRRGDAGGGIVAGRHQRPQPDVHHQPEPAGDRGQGEGQPDGAHRQPQMGRHSPGDTGHHPAVARAHQSRPHSDRAQGGQRHGGIDRGDAHPPILARHRAGCPQGQAPGSEPGSAQGRPG